MPDLYSLNANTLDVAIAIVVRYTLTNNEQRTNKMTSQEKAIKKIEATARKWARRQARWAAWKAKQATAEVKPKLDALGNL